MKIEINRKIKEPKQHDFRGSVYHSIIHIENPTRCNCVSKFYFIYI